ncbi:MAG: 4Fe-4S binding protein, partial [Peptococcaceae bacterium]|nr:4Fe-4S binding protein [Peptococcaceae bacterium]
MAKADYTELKRGGFMRQVQKDCFSMRLRTVGGKIEAAHLSKVYDIAQKYGAGYIHLTARQGIEIPFIKLADVEQVKQELAVVGLQPGACGPRVRTVTACQGITICPSGLFDTLALAQEIDQRYFGLELPHKFKFGVTGCRNNCLKAEENDLGIKGGVELSWQADKCSFCGLCTAVCPTQAIDVLKAAKDLVFRQDDCVNCGKCGKSCPVGAWEGTNGYVLAFGGTLGNSIAMGRGVIPILQNKADLFKVIDATLAFFQAKGKQGERFRLTLDRVGWEVFIQSIQEVLA